MCCMGQESFRQAAGQVSAFALHDDLISVMSVCVWMGLFSHFWL